MSLAGWDATKKFRYTGDAGVIDADLTDVPLVLNLMADEQPDDPSDDFEGTDGNAPDPILWTVEKLAADGTAQINSNKLRLLVPSTSADEEMAVHSVFSLSGDFDVEVEFTHVSSDPPSSSFSYPALLHVTFENDVFAFIGYLLDSAGVFGIAARGETTYTVPTPTTEKLRLVRTGSTLVGYHWSGTQWEWDGDPAGITFDAGFTETSNATFSLRSLADFNSGVTEDFDNFIINSGTPVWPDTSLPGSGKTGFDASPVFDELTPTDVADDFDGTDEDEADARLWDVANNSATGIVEILTNKLRLSIPSTSSDESIVLTSKYLLTGDFDIQIDYDLISYDPPSSSLSRLVDFRLEMDTGYFQIYVQMDSSGDHDTITASPADSWTLHETVYETGKLRIKRVGSTVTTYYWTGTQWEWAGNTSGHSFSDTDTSDAMVYLGITADFDAGGTTDLDNFTINEGTVVWTDTPKKLAVEIGNTGVECYGEIENWDYNNKSAQLHVKVPSALASINLVLNLYYDSTQDDNVFYVGDTDQADDELYPSPHSLYYTGGSYSTRHVIAPGSIDATGAVRLKFGKYESASYVLDKCYIGHGTVGGNEWDFDGDQVQVTFNGGDTSVTISTADDGLLSDVIDLEIDPTKPIVVSYYQSAYKVPYTTTLPSGGTAYQISGVDSAADTAPTGYGASSAWHYIIDILSVAPSKLVWDSNFVAVYHMSQDPSVGGACILDSTSNANHGTPTGLPSGNLVDGLVGKALLLELADYIDISDVGGAYGTYTIESLARVDALDSVALSYMLDASAGRTIVAIDNTTGSTTSAELAYYDGTWKQIGTAITADGSWYSIAWALDASGSAGYVYVDGTQHGTAAYSSTNLDGVVSVSDDSGIDSFLGLLGELRISNMVRSAAWIKATNYSLRDDFFTVALDVVAVVHVVGMEMTYGNLVGQNLVVMQMTYSLRIAIMATMEMPYSIKLAIQLAMHYGDAHLLTRVINQHYGDAPALLRSMVMKYEDMLPLVKPLEMPYLIRKSLNRILEARYTLAGEPLVKVLEQQYNLLNNYFLTKGLTQPYMLQEGNRLQYVSCTVAINGVTVNPHHINVEYSKGEFVASGEVHLSKESEYIQISLGDDLEITINGETHVFIVESPPKRSRRGAGNTNYVVSGVSPAIRLTADWSDTITCVFEPDTARNIFEALADPIVVDWQVVDFPVLKDTLYANNEDRIAVMRKITQSVGAIIQSNPDGTLRVVYAYPVHVDQWDVAAPEYFLTDSEHFTVQDETFKHNKGFNRYEVSNSATPEDRIWPEQEDDSVKMFEVPWKGTHATLEHSSGSGVVMPEYMGIVEKTIEETVEFKAGFSRTSKPIYGNLQVNWLREQLGAITYAEDGNLEAEVKDGSTEGYSLADIIYTTKYKEWKIDNGTECDVQYLLRVEVDEQDSSQSCS